MFTFKKFFLFSSSFCTKLFSYHSYVHHFSLFSDEKKSGNQDLHFEHNFSLFLVFCVAR